MQTADAIELHRQLRPGERIAVVGSRDYPNLSQVRRFVASLPKDVIIVSGGARGVDHEAEKSAYLFGLPDPIIFKPNWARHGDSAGMVRNIDIVYAADRMVVFWDGKSTGCMHAAQLMRAEGKPVTIVVGRRKPLVLSR